MSTAVAVSVNPALDSFAACSTNETVFFVDTLADCAWYAASASSVALRPVCVERSRRALPMSSTETCDLSMMVATLPIAVS